MRNASRFEIRPLLQSDVHEILGLIRDVRQEFGLATRVAALLEPSDYRLMDIYRHRRSAYFIALMGERIVGGAGIAPLAQADWTTCELQRMYVRLDNRRCGLGQELLDRCLAAARSFDFERCYAETVSQMSGAIAFYERNGFQPLKAPMGKTGHAHNDCWMALAMTRGSAHI